ncbi:hypothetical protein MLD52_21890 [Puniceicoccaceae bacterium K14]|nr:hypothetical protein [Puniceicoccaceae bacterium K14]
MGNWKGTIFLVTTLVPFHQGLSQSNSGTLCYSEEELSNLFKKTASHESHLDTEDIEEMEIVQLKPFNVQADDLKYNLPHPLEENIDREKDRRTLLRLRRKADFDLISSMRADDAFWTGENDANRNPDIPQVGSIDFTPIINALVKSFSGKKKKELFDTR